MTASQALDETLPEDLEGAILRLKQERNAILLAHFYQESEVQDLADVVGDSLALAQAATRVEKDVIVFCGVNFMAETAKILNPTLKVVVPDLDAGCTLSDGCPADEFRAFIEKHPGAKVISYINCSAEVKALSHIICTSANAVKVLQQFDGEPVIFAPDRHLARFAGQQALQLPFLRLFQQTLELCLSLGDRTLVAFSFAQLQQDQGVIQPTFKPLKGRKSLLQLIALAQVQHDFRYSSGQEYMYGWMVDRAVGQDINEARHVAIHFDPIVNRRSI